ncbi:EAL domain-containing protein [Saccharopolyspora spinosporotrichia]
MRVSVNLSGRFSAEVDFLDAVGAILADSGIDLHRVVLEVTETSLVELSAAARDAMHALIRLGVSFAVDDFGTGYSSLARLKDLPAQVIKLDRQFISGLETQEADRAIVRSAIDMAHATDRRCVAEGGDRGPVPPAQRARRGRPPGLAVLPPAAPGRLPRGGRRRPAAAARPPALKAARAADGIRDRWS